mgnify:CR=1 FL=1
MNKPLIIWNHRWEYDKNPEDFFRLLFDLKKYNYSFTLAVLGETYQEIPKIFLQAKVELSDEIIHWGYVKNTQDYIQWLKKGDVIPVTSMQDFFGESLVQAMYYNCYPLVPNRLVFPEHFPSATRSKFVYSSNEDMFQKITNLFSDLNYTRSVNVRQYVTKYLWGSIVSQYDDVFEKMTR